MPVETHKTFCRFCHALCGLEVDVECGRGEDRLLAVRGDRDHPISRGYVCPKGRQLAAQHHHPDRLRAVLRRRDDGSFDPIASDDAIDEVAGRLQTILDRDGPSAVAVYSGTHGLFGHARPLIISWIRALGSPWYFTPNTIDQPSKHTASARHGSWHAGIHRFWNADVMLFVGCNPGVAAWSQEGGPPYADAFRHLKDARRRGMKIIVVDPRRSELARIADVHLQVRPGEDPTLLAGFTRVILEEQRHDVRFCEQHTSRLDILCDAVSGYDPAYVERRTGVPADELERAARLFAAGPRGGAIAGTGVNMAPRPDVTQHFVVALNSLCGRVNREGDPVPNPGVLVPDHPRRAEVRPPRAIWGSGRVSRFRGLGEFMGEMPINVFADEVLTEGDGQIKALVCVGGNPVVAFPDQRKVVRALESLELSVALDVKLTETASRCDYVFGCKLSAEKPGFTQTAEGQLDVPFAQYTPALLAPEFDVIEEWEFFWELARRMGTPLSLGRTPLDLENRPTSDGFLDLLTADSRVPLDEVRRQPGGALFPPEREAVVQPAREGRGEARLDLAPAAVAAQLHEIRGEPSSVGGGYGADAARFSHRLISRRMIELYNSTGDHLPGLRRRWAYNPAFMNPACIAELGVAPGDVVRIESDHDFIYGVVETTDAIGPGVISMSHARGGGPERDGDVRRVGSTTNRLVSTERDFEPISGMARQSAIPVNVRRLSPEELASIAPGEESPAGH